MIEAGSERLNLLVLGGSGFLSSAVVDVALRQGHHVSAVTRGMRPLAPNVTPIIVDRKDRDAFAHAIDRQHEIYDLVIDCIGFEPDDARQDVEVFRLFAKHLVFISTDFVYDPTRRSFPQNDDNLYYLPDGYGGKKRMCERVIESEDTGAMAWTVLRPCHIYGPGSLLGCLPTHGRDEGLIARLWAGEPLRLVGDGHFLQQPIFARDLAKTALSCAGNAKCNGQIYLTAGPDIVESKHYYQIIADELGVELRTEELPVRQYLADNPGHASFLCHRIYDLSKLREHGLHVPDTPLTVGLREHVQAVLAGVGKR